MSVKSLVHGVTLAFETYPAVLLALINAAIVLAAHFGYHVSASQLTSIAVIVTGFVGVIVHNSVTPNIKVNTTTRVNPDPVVPNFPLPKE